MINVQAAQHIYANVEADRSPQGRGGLQTLLFSRELLTEDEVREIEPRLLYFSSMGASRKRLYFALENGRPVISQIVGLPGVDRHGREGRYLAHSLVFSAADSLHLGGDALGSAARFTFATTVEDALSQSTGGPGNLLPVTVSLDDQPQHADPNAAHSLWPETEFCRLTLLALRAAHLAQEKMIVALVGQPLEVEQALGVALVGVPSPLRAACSFDTCFDGCNPVGLPYWAVGLSEAPRSLRFITVDLAQRRVLSDSIPPAACSYERWVAHLVLAGARESLLAKREAAFVLCAWLDSNATDTPMPEVSDAFLLSSVHAANREQVQKVARRRLEAIVPPQLAGRLFGPLFAEQAEEAQWRVLWAGFDPRMIADAVVQLWVEPGSARPTPDVLNALAGILPHLPADHELKLYQACWAGDAGRLAAQLESLTDDRYGEFVDHARRNRLVPAPWLIVAGKGGIFVEALSGLDLFAAVELADVFARLSEVGEGSPAAAVLREMERRNATECRQFVRAALRHPTLQLAELGMPGREEALVLGVLDSERAAEEIGNLIQWLLQVNAVEHLNRLLPWISALVAGERAILSDYIRGHPGVPPELTQALVAPLPEKPGVLARVKALFGDSAKNRPKP